MHGDITYLSWIILTATSINIIHANQTSCVCYQTAVTSLVEEGVASKQIAVLGGSHGGYLACHLLGKFPVNQVYYLINVVSFSL